MISNSISNYDIHNELKITINTSIPGYQKIDFKPSMVKTDLNGKNDKIYFDPLIKISEKSVDYIPENMRISSFLNKGLFESLLNNNKNSQKKTLSNAKYNGYIDNNIKITLDTVLPKGSVIYINKNPYLITDLQWTKGSWKIKTNADLSGNATDDDLNIIYGQNYNGTKASETIQNKEINQSIVTTADITRPNVSTTNVARPNVSTTNVARPNVSTTNVARPNVSTTNVARPNVSTTNVNRPNVSTTNVARPNVSTTNVARPNVSTTTTTASTTNDQKRSTTPDATTSDINVTNKSSFSKTIPDINNDNNSISKFNTSDTNADTDTDTEARDDLTSSRDSSITDDFMSDRNSSTTTDDTMTTRGSETSTSVPTKSSKDTLLSSKSSISSVAEEVVQHIPLMKSNDRTNEILKKYFSGYYSTINFVYKNITDYRDFIKNILAISTNTDVKDKPTDINLNDDAYNTSLKMLDVIKNEGKGECLFLAVADAINFYNSKNKNKIIYKNYGDKTPFTKDNLRQIVLDFFLVKIKEDATGGYSSIPTSNAEDLNRQFKDSIQSMKKTIGKIENGTYKDVLTNIYKINPNFLVNHIDEMPDKNTQAELYDNPFYAIDINNENDIKNYILSDNYWADTNTIEALNSTLKIKIIPFGRDHITKPIQVYPTEEFNDWTHYLFLYYQNAHYELVSFNFMYPNERITIFKRETILDADNNLKFLGEIQKNTDFYIVIPPIYILFTIFGSSYYNQTEEVKNNFKLFPNIMTIFGKSMNSILTKYDTSSEDAKQATCNFIKEYKKLFPSFKGLDDCNSIKGGQNVYNINNYYNKSYPHSNKDSNKHYVKNYLNKKDPKKPFYITYISIDLELHPGTTITPKELEKLNCQSKWNAIRKAYSEFTGKPYVIKPIYNYNTKTAKNIGRKHYKNNTKKYTVNLNHYTKKHKRPTQNYTKKRK